MASNIYIVLSFLGNLEVPDAAIPWIMIRQTSYNLIE